MRRSGGDPMPAAEASFTIPQRVTGCKSIITSGTQDAAPGIRESAMITVTAVRGYKRTRGSWVVECCLWGSREHLIMWYERGSPSLEWDVSTGSCFEYTRCVHPLWNARGPPPYEQQEWTPRLPARLPICTACNYPGVPRSEQSTLRSILSSSNRTREAGQP